MILGIFPVLLAVGAALGVLVGLAIVVVSLVALGPFAIVPIVLFYALFRWAGLTPRQLRDAWREDMARAEAAQRDRTT